MIFRKIPVISSAPIVQKESTFKKLFQKIIFKILSLKIWEKEYWVLKIEKTIKKIRILALKIDNFTFSILRKLRERRKIERKDDSFWENFKKE